MTTKEENAADLAYQELTRMAELAIVSRVIDDALAANYTVSVEDDFEGEGDFTVIRSTDRGEILTALRSTCGDRLYIHNKEGKSIGWISFIWGNGCDCLADHVASEEVCRLLVGAEQLADELER